MFFRKINFDDPERGNSSAIFIGLCDYKAQLGLDLYNVTWCSRSSQDRDTTSFHHGVLLGTAVSGLIINFLVILYWITAWRRFKQIAHLFNVNLVIVDLLDCMAVPLMVQNDFGNINVSLGTCRALLLVHHGAFVARPLFLIFIWISRYNSLVIRSTTKTMSHMQWHQIFCTAVAWGVAVFSAVPSLIFANVGTVLSGSGEGGNNSSSKTSEDIYQRSDSRGTCGIPFAAFDRSYVSLQMTFVRLLMWTLTPLCVLCVTNILIIKMLHQNKFKRKVKPILILLVQLIGFLATEVPFTVTVFSNLATPVDRNCSANIGKENVALITHAFTVAHLSTNPLLYVILGVSVKTLYREFRTGQLWKSNKEARRQQASSCSRLDKLSGSTTPQSSRSVRTRGVVDAPLVEDCVFITNTVTTTPATTTTGSSSVSADILFIHPNYHETTSSTNTSIDGDTTPESSAKHPYLPLGNNTNGSYYDNINQPLDLAADSKTLYFSDTDTEDSEAAASSRVTHRKKNRAYHGFSYTTGNRRKHREKAKNTINFKSRRRSNSRSDLRKLANYLRPRTTSFTESEISAEANFSTYPCVFLKGAHCRKRGHRQQTVNEESNAEQSFV
ncbi:envelope glycoprotein UL33 [Elephantid betaherpesvirus 1]|uniref:Envelope glycoprotein UL33 n=1 Tax=Elephantid herpesvirus 1 TaxID=146015 RepID=M4JX07_ELHV1|nr:envelope glycoprotein UL33 [Elephantid betaherpesvirus 1]